MKCFRKNAFKRKIEYILYIFGGITACLFSGCGQKEILTLESVDTAMGTIIQQRIYVSEGQDTQLADKVIEQINRLEAEELSWRIETSELAGVNAGQGKVKLSEEMTDILQTCFQVAEASKGAFDPTIGAVVRLWDIDSWAQMEDTQYYHLPQAALLENELEAAGYEKLSLDGVKEELYLPEGMYLDLGAVGKGIALDRTRELLEEQASGAVISAGGSILTFGEKPDQTPWRVGITDPENPSGSIGYLELQGQWCISTSGDYERYVEVDGVRYHHIIDPDTGYPADSGVRSVTILTKDGLLSDALSTACFVLGVEEGMELAEQFDGEALFVTVDGELKMTTGMETCFHTR